MTCYYPLNGYRSRRANESGKRSIVFSPQYGYQDLPVTVPCGQCIGCRLDRSKQWAIRCVHEAQMHTENCFVTLTYNDEHLPADHSLDKRHFQLFMKRLRKANPKTIRYYHCGEYGEESNRAHYHAILFGHDFPDKIFYTTTKTGERLYVSEQLNKIWGKGFCTIGSVTFESAAYVARYIMKKVNGEKAEEHYMLVDPTTGECHFVLPEYTTMSRRPGIGKAWYDKYKDDAYPTDYIIIGGRKMRPPRFYDNIYEQEDPKGYLRTKHLRLEQAADNADNNTTDRLRTREKVKKSQLNQLKRELE